MNDLDRQQQIIELLRDRPFASVRELQQRLGVSAATVRRDIDKIDEAGGARKVYGGVSALDGAALHTAFARPYDENRDLAVDAKRQIADLAATMVADGDSVIVNGGSTCFHLGAKLADRNIRLFTNSMPLAAYLGDHGKCALTVAGGELHREPRVIYSPSQPTTFYASKFFLGAQGISAEGLLESHPLMVRSIQELSGNVDQIVVLADSRKFSIHARNVALPLSRVGTLITDDRLSDQAAKMVENAGITLRIATDGGAT
ncbi:DeoR/GlpR family DNA-binding transcription regulator [Nitratireductor sp. ZSWI3]|uniref:DeoR/GlpR family DNA-binding transcription regulator n=1 Tax=Nitratireductor sp. ZSWI3 TaxID=2966359 RepID=UPI00214F7BEB|nr:DeoR/GlpR family DNA-binding transcription regulator [Nitratireductor sp. ZSWI3]MCR4266146.1 DeoR/GlpR family DNA-binding transcription regulator [Nitratireductor sp. ZSWI3]